MNNIIHVINNYSYCFIIYFTYWFPWINFQQSNDFKHCNEIRIVLFFHELFHREFPKKKYRISWKHRMNFKLLKVLFSALISHVLFNYIYKNIHFHKNLHSTNHLALIMSNRIEPRTITFYLNRQICSISLDHRTLLFVDRVEASWQGNTRKRKKR